MANNFRDKKSRNKRRPSHRRRNIIVAALTTIVTIAALTFTISCIPPSAAGSHASADEPAIAASPEQLLEVITNPDLTSLPLSYRGFNVSFNPVHHIPNWVAWELTPQEVRTSVTSRRDKFRPDPDVPGCPIPADYRNSGFDRGHIAPAADMKWDTLAMHHASYLTNICPQSHELNQGAWMTLENLCRQRALIDSSLIIIAGPVLSMPPIDTIGEAHVTVPRKFFKVILAPHAKPKPVALAFLMDNAYIPGGLQATTVTVDSVEAITGHDFFSILPDSLENSLESTNFHRFWRL